MKDRRMKIIWSSNCVWSQSGYARFTDDWSQRIIKDDWPMRLIGWAGLAGGVIQHKGIYTYPQVMDIWGGDALVEHTKHFGADVSFSFQDVHTLNPQFLQQVPRWIPYAPIDREEVQPMVLNNLRYAYKIITFSKFGQKALERHGFASTLIPEGVDVNQFKPLDKMKMREELGWPKDKFIFGMIGANKPDGISRKGWQQALEAFAVFVKKYPDSMFFHEFNQGGGFDIVQYATHLGILDKIIGFDMYQSVIHGSPEMVNKWLNGCDVMMNCSTTEGFGLVITESQSAGTPVLVTDCMSMPELIVEGKTGEKVQTALKLWTSGGGHIFFPSYQDMALKMEKLYKAVKENENKISTSCRAWIVDNYNIDKIFTEKWVKFLEDLQTDLLGQPKVDTNLKK